MYFPENLVEEVRQKSDIVDVVGSYVSLKKKGAQFWGLCPFHSEKSPSFTVNQSMQTFHCFGCGEGGDAFAFLMKYENYSFQEAVKELALKAGVTIPETVDSKEEVRRRSLREKILSLNKDAALYFVNELKSEGGKNAREYFEKRQLSPQTLIHFGLGYSGLSGKGIIEYLRKKGYSDEVIRNSGLSGYNEKSGTYSFFWNRVMFPIMDMNNRVIGFGGRVLGDGEPKYLNSPETPVFDKRKNLYGLNYARHARSGNMIICEGYMDVIAMHQAGFTQAVASLGTAFTPDQARIIGRYTKNVLLAYDSDGPGIKAALRNIEILKQVGLGCRIINMKPAKDPDEFIKTYGKEAFEERIRNAENSFFFEVRVSADDYDLNDPEQRTAFHNSIGKRLASMDELARENYLEPICSKYNIKPDAMRRFVINNAINGDAKLSAVAAPKKDYKKNTDDKTLATQELMLSWIGTEPGIYAAIEKYISIDDFTDELYKKIADKLFTGFKTPGFVPSSILSYFEDENEQKLVGRLFARSLPQMSTKEEKNKALKDLLIKLKTENYLRLNAQSGNDINALTKAIEGKKELQKLSGINLNI
ncbi:MAG: DNA primase [Lachnospiraceae bacterium]|nr:DNA primase [Lachnospiraceae bacterium]